MPEQLQLTFATFFIYVNSLTNILFILYFIDLLKWGQVFAGIYHGCCCIVGGNAEEI